MRSWLDDLGTHQLTAGPVTDAGAGGPAGGPITFNLKKRDDDLSSQGGDSRGGGSDIDGRSAGGGSRRSGARRDRDGDSQDDRSSRRSGKSAALSQQSWRGLLATIVDGEAVQGMPLKERVRFYAKAIKNILVYTMTQRFNDVLAARRRSEGVAMWGGGARAREGAGGARAGRGRGGGGRGRRTARTTAHARLECAPNAPSPPGHRRPCHPPGLWSGRAPARLPLRHAAELLR